ncbi:MAG: transporter ATP-binding protein [Frankiales bacterium]|nr:transporter ATP-binding protein [Frankiales bacterium]
MSRSARALLGLSLLATGAVALPQAVAAPAPVTVTKQTLHFDVVVGPQDDTRCTIVGDLYKPSTATRRTPAPAILTTNGFGGSKDDQADVGQAFAKKGYVVLSYSGMGFGGSTCKIRNDDRDWDGKGGSQLLTFLGGGSTSVEGVSVDYVKKDAKGSDGKPHAHDPRVGMVGGSYGGQIQFAIAGVDPRLDTIVPLITWNDLVYSLGPNNTTLRPGTVLPTTTGVFKYQWTSLFVGLGIADGVQGAQDDPSRLVGLCPNFGDTACAGAVASHAGLPYQASYDDLHHASVAAFTKDIRIPTLLGQGQADTLFNLQEASATYRALKAQGTPVKMMWQQWGHSGGPAKGEFDLATPDTNYQGRVIAAWFDHYLKGTGPKPSLDFEWFRDWVSYTGDAAPAYGRSATFPAGRPQTLHLSGSDALVADRAAVQDGTAQFVAPAAPASYTETSALDQEQDLRDAPGTTASWTSGALAAPLEVVGSPVLDLKGLDSPTAAVTQADEAGALILFAKLLDVAPDGSTTLVHRLVSPVRVPEVGKPYRIELPGIVHRFDTGHRLQLVLAGSDAAYGRNLAPQAVTVDISKAALSTLTLPATTGLRVAR